MIENKRDVYKFWLGLTEKFLIVFFVSVMVPILVGRLDIPPIAVIIWIVSGLLLLGLAGFLCWKLWNLR